MSDTCQECGHPESKHEARETSEKAEREGVPYLYFERCRQCFQHEPCAFTNVERVREA